MESCLHDAAPLPEHTVRRETPDGGQAAVTLYPVFPGIDIHYHDVHAASCPLEPAAPGVLEISHCREGRMEYRLGSRYFYLAPGDLSVARQDVLPTLAAFPTGHYHGITVTVDPGLAPRCLSCFLEDVEVQPAALAEKFCAAGGYFAARSSRRVEHVFSELYQVPEDLRRGYLKVKILELLLFLSALEVPAQLQAAAPGLSRGQVSLARKTADYLLANTESKVTVQELSRHFGASAAYRGTGITHFARFEHIIYMGVGREVDIEPCFLQHGVP